MHVCDQKLSPGSKPTNLMLISNFEHVSPEVAKDLRLTACGFFGLGDPSNEMSYRLFATLSVIGLLSCSVFPDVASLVERVGLVCDILNDFCALAWRARPSLCRSTPGPRARLSRSAPMPS